MSSEMGKVTIYGLTEEGLGAAEGRGWEGAGSHIPCRGNHTCKARPTGRPPVTAPWLVSEALQEEAGQTPGQLWHK